MLNIHNLEFGATCFVKSTVSLATIVRPRISVPRGKPRFRSVSLQVTSQLSTAASSFSWRFAKSDAIPVAERRQGGITEQVCYICQPQSPLCHMAVQFASPDAVEQFAELRTFFIQSTLERPNCHPEAVGDAADRRPA